MSSISTQRLLKAYSDLILQKKCIFSSCKKFGIGCGHSYLIIHGPFGQFLTQNYVRFFKYSLNFQGRAQKFELNKVWHANFIEFKYDHTNPKNEWAFEKTNKPCFYLPFDKSNLKVIFLTLYLEHQKEIISYLESKLNLCGQ